MGLEIREQIVLESLPLQMLETQLVHVKQTIQGQGASAQPETVSHNVNINSLPLSFSTLSFS